MLYSFSMKSIFEGTTLLKKFSKAKSSKTLAHAYLFISPDSLTNKTVAMELAKLILCDNYMCDSCENCLKINVSSHPDLLIFPKEKNFLVDDANEIISLALEKPMLTDKKIIIINDIDNATIQAQNKILKTLEEPPESVIFLITSTNESKILPTIISRTQKEFISALSKNQILTYFENAPCKNLALAVESEEYWLGKIKDVLENTYFEQYKKLAHEIAHNLVSSKEVSKYTVQVAESKESFDFILSLLQEEFSKALTKNTFPISVEGIVLILDSINLANEKKQSNVNLNLIADNLLLKIVEIKYYYKNL